MPRDHDDAPSLFDGPQYVRATAPVESHEAAARGRRFAATKRHRVLSALHAHGPMTCDQAEQVVGLPHQSCSAVLHWLERHGFVERTDERRRTRTGSAARVYAMTAAGRAALAEAAR